MEEKCALDVAAYGGLTMERVGELVGELLGVTAGRICQIEKQAVRAIQEASRE